MSKEDFIQLYGEHNWEGSLLCKCHADNPVKSFCLPHSEYGIYLQAVKMIDTMPVCLWCFTKLGGK